MNDFESVVYVSEHGENMSIDEEIDGIKTVKQMEEEAVSAAEATEENPKDEEKPVETEAEPPKEEAPKTEEEKPVEDDTPKEPAPQKEDGFGKPGHTPAGVQSRINELTRTNREQKSAIEQRDARIAELERQLSLKKDPTKADFANEEEYNSYLIEKQVGERIAKMEADRAAKAAFEEEYRGFQESEELARKLLPDYDSVMNGAQDLPGSQRLSAIIRKDKVLGAQILYTLNKYPARRAEYIAASTEDARAAILYRIQGELHDIMDRALNTRQQQASQPQTPPAQQTPTQAAAPTATGAQLREPGEMSRSGAVTRKKLNPSECSMEEWMSDGY